MTRSYQGDEKERTPFSAWIRALPNPLDSTNFDCQNLDYIWFCYRAGWFITIEEKRFGGKSRSAQSDTHSIIAQLLTLASGQPIQTMRGKRPIVYRGHFTVVFENTMPDDSTWVSVNNVRSNNPNERIIQLLKKGE